MPRSNWGISLALLSCASADAAVPVIGGPSYDPNTQTGYVVTRLNRLGQPVSNGVAVGSANYVLNGVTQSSVPIRWDSQGNVTPMSTLGSNASSLAVNTSGIAVGAANIVLNGPVDFGNRYVAAEWDSSGHLTQLASPSTPTDFAQAQHINASGTVIGQLDTTPSMEEASAPVRWANAGAPMETLQGLGFDQYDANQTPANGINDAGTVVGSSILYVNNVSQFARAVRWDASSTAPVQLPNLSTNNSGQSISFANAINNAGTIAGGAEVYNGDTDLGGRAVRWSNNGASITRLGDLGTNSAGVTNARANTINSQGDAIGYARKYNGDTNLGNFPVRWNADTTAAIPLGLLGTTAAGTTQSVAYAINDSGYAVGYAEKYDSNNVDLGSRAVAWTADGSVIDLNTLIDPSSGWTLTEADGIDNSNYIAGVGMYDPDGTGPQAAYQRGFLIQIPEPATLTIIALWATILGRRRHA